MICKKNIKTITNVENEISQLQNVEGNVWINTDEEYENMVEAIRKKLNFTSLRFNRLDDMLDAVGLPPENLCTYCWNGEE